MDLAYAEVIFENGGDDALHRRGQISEAEIRRQTVRVLAGGRSVLPVIGESVRAALGLETTGFRRLQLANGTWTKLPVAGPVVVRYLGRSSLTSAVVCSDDQEFLLGMIPMGELDLYVHPVSNELLPVHPEGPVMSLK